MKIRSTTNNADTKLLAVVPSPADVIDGQCSQVVRMMRRKMQIGMRNDEKKQGCTDKCYERKLWKSWLWTVTGH